MIMGALKSYSQAINCNDRVALKASLKALHESDQQIRLELNQKMQTLKMPPEGFLNVRNFTSPEHDDLAPTFHIA